MDGRGRIRQQAGNGRGSKGGKRLKPNNFVAPLTNIEKPSESLPVAPPLGRRITVDPGAIFAEPVVKQPTPIDYVSQGIGFNLKYAPLFVILAILAYGLAIKSKQDFWFGTVLFGTLSVIGYWMLGFMENIFEPTSGHVVRSYFGYKVLKAEIESSERTQAMYYETEQMRLENERLKNIIVEQKVIEQVNRHSLPQPVMNQLTNFDDADPFEDDEPASRKDVYTIPLNELKNPKDEARTILLDFLTDLYSQGDEVIKPDGTLKKGTVAPWVAKSDLPIPIKRKMIDLINQTMPKLFTQEGTQPWRLNIAAYPDIHSAIDALNTSVTRDL